MKWSIRFWKISYLKNRHWNVLQDDKFLIAWDKDQYLQASTLTLQFEEKGVSFDAVIYIWRTDIFGLTDVQLLGSFAKLSNCINIHQYNKTAVNVRMFVYLHPSPRNGDTLSCLEVMRIASIHIVCGIWKLSPRKRQIWTRGAMHVRE